MPVSTTVYPFLPGSLGRVFYVGDTDATLGITASNTGYGNPDDPNVTYGIDPLYPFATLAYCITNACVAGRGDTIYVVPGTAITIASAAALAIDKGVHIIGMGDLADRPVITWTTDTAATITMTGAGASFQNFTFTGNMNALVSMIVVSAADCAIRDCTFNLLTSTNYVLGAILTTAGASRLVVERCRFIGDLGTTVRHGGAAVRIVGGDGIIVRNNYMTGAFSATLGCVEVITTASTNLQVTDNLMRVTTTSAAKCIVDTQTGSTGYINGNRFQILSSNAPISGATFSWGLNYYSATLGTVMLIGV